MSLGSTLASLALCGVLLAFFVVFLKNWVAANRPTKFICKFAVGLAGGGSIAAVLLAMISIALGTIEQRGVLTDLIGLSLVVAGSGIVLANAVGCGSRNA